MITTDEDAAANEATAAFEREIGVTGIKSIRTQAGNREFLKFQVGREAPLYAHALLAMQRALSSENPFRGAVGLAPTKPDSFPSSIEASALLILLTRSTREVQSDSSTPQGYAVPYVPFQKREDHQLAQPASHIVRGRRGVGKSTLIRRATALLAESTAVVCVLDMQAYSSLSGDDLIRELMHDVCAALASSGASVAKRMGIHWTSEDLFAVSEKILAGDIPAAKISISVNRALKKLTSTIPGNAFVFLDDFHLIDHDAQPVLLHALHGALKGAKGWIKVAGLSSLLNVYSPTTQQGLQVPGDAQFISLDLTLVNPEAAETHLRAIMEGFFAAVGYAQSRSVIPDAVFRRLAWANAGVPRDFLQMFGSSLEHAQRNRRSAITLSDVNMAIGEYGQRKIDDLQRDARNDEGSLRDMLTKLETLCLEQNQVNAFLIRSDKSRERDLVQILSDLRMVHLIHQSITPDKAGERYEAFILDYSLFTGFRRRPNVREMVPREAQFKAADLRALPKVFAGFLAADTKPLKRNPLKSRKPSTPN